MLGPSTHSHDAESRLISDEPVAIIMSAARSVSPEMHAAFPNAHVITDGDPEKVGRVPGTPLVHPGSRVTSMQAYSAILEAAQEAKATAIVTPFETGLPAGAFARTVLGLPGTQVQAAVRCSDKFIMKRCFRASGIRTAEFARVKNQQQLATMSERCGGEVIIKPLFGGGSAGVTKLSSGIHAQGDSFPFLCERSLNVVAEFHIDGIVQGSEVKFALASQYGEPMLRSVKARRTYSSEILDQDSAIAQACLRITEQSVKAVRLKESVFHAEVLLTDDGLYMGEIACRPAGGGVCLAVELSCGIDLTRYSWQADCGHDTQINIPNKVRRIWHAALPDGLSPTQRQHLSDLPGHLHTTEDPRVAMRAKTESTSRQSLEAGATRGGSKGVFYSATNAGCTYFDLGINPAAAGQVRAFLEQSR